MTAFSLSEDSKGKSLAIFYDDGDTVTIPESHVAFKSIVDLWFAGEATDEAVRTLADPMKTLGERMSQLSERVTIDGRNIYFDGDILRGELADVIKDLFENGKELDFKPLVNFLEKAMTNPGLQSIDQLYRWVKNGDLVITPTGDVVAYKGVRIIDGDSYSSHYGEAWVNGEKITGQIPYPKGAIVTMPRAEVNADGQIGCSQGLHVGTYEYASGFADNRTLLIQFNPRDVVSVPNDCNFHKIRICRLVVLDATDQRLTERVYAGGVEDDYSTASKEPEEAPVAAETSVTEDGRDEKGRFTSFSAKKAVRDSKGRFIRLV